MGFSPEVRSKAFQYEMPQYPDPDHASAEDRFFPNHRRYFFSHQVFRFKFSEAELLDSKTFWEVEKNCGKSEKLRSEKRRVWRSSEVATCKSPTTQSRRSSQSDCQGKVQQVQLHSPGREKSRRKLERNGEDDDPSDFVRLRPDHHRNRGNHWRPLLWWVFCLDLVAWSQNHVFWARAATWSIGLIPSWFFSSGCWEATAFGVSCPPPINVK